jgi:hypothetical protein
MGNDEQALTKSAVTSTAPALVNWRNARVVMDRDMVMVSGPELSSVNISVHNTLAVARGKTGSQMQPQSVVLKPQ